MNKRGNACDGEPGALTTQSTQELYYIKNMGYILYEIKAKQNQNKTGNSI